MKIFTVLGEDVGGETRTPRKGETRFSPLLDVFDLWSNFDGVPESRCDDDMYIMSSSFWDSIRAAQNKHEIGVNPAA